MILRLFYEACLLFCLYYAAVVFVIVMRAFMGTLWEFFKNGGRFLDPWAWVDKAGDLHPDTIGCEKGACPVCQQQQKATATPAKPYQRLTAEEIEAADREYKIFL